MVRHILTCQSFSTLGRMLKETGEELEIIQYMKSSRSIDETKEVRAVFVCVRRQKAKWVTLWNMRH